jgi:uncharacterized protein YndB with AHSA1/START domain
MRVQKSIEIKAPPEKVWPWLIEPDKIKRWCNPLEKCECELAKICSLGDELCFNKKPWKLKCTVTAWVEKKKIAFSVREGPWRDYNHEWTIEEWNIGPTQKGSRITIVEEPKTPEGRFEKIYHKIFPLEKKVFEKNIENNLGDLKKCVEVQLAREEPKTPEKSADEISLLKSNHASLHDAFWNNHKVAWQVTSIFIPVLFAMLGYLVKGDGNFSRFQALMGFLVMEGLLFIWLLIMRIFEYYNDIRRTKLREIEDRLYDSMPAADFELYNLHYSDSPWKLRFSPMTIYYTLFGVYTALNLAFLLYKFVS